MDAHHPAGSAEAAEFLGEREGAQPLAVQLDSGLTRFNPRLEGLSVVSAESPLRPAGMLPLRLLLDGASSATRSGVPPVVTPSQSAIAVLALQLSVAVPASALLPSSSPDQRVTLSVTSSPSGP